MRQYRYHVVILSVTLTLVSAAWSKSIAGKAEVGYYAAPPPMQWISDFTHIDEDSHEVQIEREISAIEW